jgi:hypothetical protein
VSWRTCFSGGGLHPGALPINDFDNLLSKIRLEHCSLLV